MNQTTRRLPDYRRMELPSEFADVIEGLGGLLGGDCEMFLCVFVPESPPHLIYPNRMGGGFADTDNRYFAARALRYAIESRKPSAPRSNLHQDARVIEALRGFEEVVRKLTPQGLFCRCTIVSPSNREAVYHSDQGVVMEVVVPMGDDENRMAEYLLDRYPFSAE